MEEKCSTFSLRKLSSRLMQMVIVTAFLLVNCLPAMAQTSTKVKGVITFYSDRTAIVKYDDKRVIDADKVILDNSKLLRMVNHEFVDLEDGIDNQISNYLGLMKDEK